jgi:hypothetical protein
MATPAAPARLAPFAYAAVLATAGWILMGAVFKLLVGTPNDLPPVLFELPLSKGMLYHLAIAAEFVIVTFAVLKPRLGWWLCAAAMIVFDVILALLIAEGETSCGCFGGRIEVAPQTMMAIDSLLLVALLASRPWSSLRWNGLGLPLVGIVALALASLPWVFDRTVALGPINGSGPGLPSAASQPATTTTPEPAIPSGLRGYVIFDAPAWVGKPIEETPLAKLMDVYAFDVNCTWVLWRWTCEHCADHLAQMALSYDGASPLVLIRLPEEKDTDKNGVIKTKPTGPLVLETTLPDTIDYVVTTPVVLVLKDGVVVSAVENPGH